MLKKIINSILFLPLVLCINSPEVLSNETKDLIDKVLEEKSNGFLKKILYSSNPECI